VTGFEDWNEINEVFLLPKLIKKHQIILMPEGCSREEIKKHQEIAVEMAVRHNVRYSDRLHIQLWDKAVGV
jgi:organic radical activating enzyme